MMVFGCILAFAVNLYRGVVCVKLVGLKLFPSWFPSWLYKLNTGVHTLFQYVRRLIEKIIVFIVNSSHSKVVLHPHPPPDPPPLRLFRLIRSMTSQKTDRSELPA